MAVNLSAQTYKTGYAATSPWGDEPERQRACLPAIPFVRVPITPLPEVYESNSDSVWALWDATVAAGVFYGR